jgi:copper chaperone CopZ
MKLPAERPPSTLLMFAPSCPACVARIERALARLDGVADVDVRLAARIIIVRRAVFGVPTDAELVDALTRTGVVSVIV